MIFNSFAFPVFFSVFFFFYWFVFSRNLKAQNFFILAGSYVFYAWGGWKFLPLLIASSAINYALGICLGKSFGEGLRKFFLLLGLIIGLGALLLFKYADFLFPSLNLILPLGISFYTFRTVGYLIDVYNRKTEPVADWVLFFAYVSFFPSLISGPIDRPKTLVPQLAKPRVFDYDQAVDGMRQILWGLFKKVVVADNCAIFVDRIFANHQAFSGSSRMLAAALYTIQIYADFSGYSDMAIGIARLLGFQITRNFDFPLFARNIAEFWRKWHISLTTWLTEYVFTPLSIAFRDLGKTGIAIAILINFTLIGIWHGASWTFVLFGFLHGLYFIPLIFRGTLNKRKKDSKVRLLPSFSELANMTGTFLLVTLTFVLFRAASIPEASGYLKGLFSSSLFSMPAVDANDVLAVFFAMTMVLCEWVRRGRQHALEGLSETLPLLPRWAAYYCILSAVVFFGEFGSGKFIYFKF